MRPARRSNRICKFAIKNTSEPTTCENPTRSQCASASAEARLRAQLVEGDFPARDARPQHGSPSPCNVPSLLHKPWKKGPMDIGAPKASRLFDDKSAGGPCHRRGRLGERSALQHPCETPNYRVMSMPLSLVLHNQAVGGNAQAVLVTTKPSCHIHNKRHRTPSPACSERKHPRSSEGVFLGFCLLWDYHCRPTRPNLSRWIALGVLK